MDVRCIVNGCACEKTIEVEVFPMGTSQLVEHSHEVKCSRCGHRWDTHSGNVPPPPPAEAATTAA
jgi:predicted Zn finger-like uncharacterized protein